MAIAGLGQGLVKAGKVSAQFVKKHPKSVLATGSGVVAGYVLGKSGSDAKPENVSQQTQKNTFGKVLIAGLALAAGMLGARKIAANLLKNPKAQKIMTPLNDAVKDLKVKIKDFSQTASHTVKNIKIKQVTPKGSEKSTMDFLIDNFKATIRSLNEDRFVCTDTAQQFSSKGIL